MLWIAAAQNPFPAEDRGPKLKHSQVEALLKQEHERSLEDAAELAKLADQLKIELEKGDRHVLSLKAVKQTEEIEKLARRIRGRLRRF
jgi:ATP-dependent helicase/DNAse subunit B